MRSPVERPNASPPIWLFFVGLLVALILLLALHLIIPNQPTEHDSEFEGFYKTGQSSRTAAASPLKVAAVGSSLVRRGLAPDSEMETLARRKGRNISFSRLARSGKNLEWLRPLLISISQDPPDILVIEAELLALTSRIYVEAEPLTLTNRIRASISQERIRLYDWGLGQESRLFGLKASPLGQQGLNMADQNQMFKQQGTPSKPVFDPAAYSMELRNFIVRDFSSLDELIPILRTIKARNCVVVILPMGRSPGAAALFPSSLDRAFVAFMERLSAQGFVAEHELIRLPQDCYSDAAHLNEKGRRLASDEFLTRLSRWMETRH